jgi:hypothetical protein
MKGDRLFNFLTLRVFVVYFYCAKMGYYDYACWTNHMAFISILGAGRRFALAENAAPVLSTGMIGRGTTWLVPQHRG